MWGKDAERERDKETFNEHSRDIKTSSVLKYEKPYNNNRHHEGNVTPLPSSVTINRSKHSSVFMTALARRRPETDQMKLFNPSSSKDPRLLTRVPFTAGILKSVQLLQSLARTLTKHTRAC